MSEIFPESPLTSLPAAVAAMGAQSQAPRPIAYAAKNTDLLLADAAERSRAAEWPWDMWCRICHIRPTSHRTEAEALEAADRHVKLQHASQAEVHKLMAAGGLSELETLRARVAELEAECRSTNEAPDDAVQELRARSAEESSAGGFPPALPWLALLDEDDRVEFLDELADSATVNASSEVRLAQIEQTCATWRLIAEAQHGHNTAPGPDAVTQSFAPVAALREVLDGEHFATVHHDWRIGRDLPEAVSASVSPTSCQACGSAPESWCPDCAACQKGCFGGFDANPCEHPNASWGGPR